MSVAHRLVHVPDILRFILAGNATFTLRSLRTGVRYTYKLSLIERSSKPAYFVKLLGGPNNVDDFRYMGVLDRQEPLNVRSTANSKVSRDAPSFVALRWFMARLNGGLIPPELEVWHEGTCGRCGQKLTVPESIAAGIGPDCAEQMGVSL